MSGEKELPASEKKLRKGLDENQDQPSQEVTSLVTALVVGAMVYIAVPRLAAFVTPLLRLEPMAIDHVDTLRDQIGASLAALTGVAETGAAVLIATAAAAGLLGNLANRRRPPKMKMPHFQYNPLAHAKQMYKPTQLLATIKLWLVSVLVIALLALLCWWHLPDAVLGAFADPEITVALAFWLPWVILPVTVLLLVISAVIDAIQKHKDFVKQNKMDHHEVKQENKEDNGDPLIKSKRIELAQEE